MRRRIYRLLPDLTSARAAKDDLVRACVDVRHMHFMARDGIDLRGLHAANVLQTSEIIPSAAMGLAIGAAMGCVVGVIVAIGYPIVGDAPQWGLAALLALAGALYGPWASSMIGISMPSERLKRFMPQVEQGQILLMVDVPVWRVPQIEARLQALEPLPDLERTEPDAPAFP